ncbi:MAG: hypothetical protein CMK09_06490 [Ponticaulis sp.]|nr:hypothetical protein [Ponticaulis sp.]|tara:strand:+ start:1184 stop:2440 length:1257 start_codon:yes stop_codon:yes gene_type:complete
MFSSDAALIVDRLLAENAQGMCVVKRVVLVTDIRFWEHSYGSHSRIRQLSRQLSEEFELTIFLLRSATRAVVESFASLNFKNAELVSYKKYSGREAKYGRQLSKHPYFKGKEVIDFAASLHAYLNDHPADAVIIEYLDKAYLIDACANAKLKILDMHDIMSARTVSLRLAGLKATIELDATTEKQILSAFDALLAISRKDVQLVKNRFNLPSALYTPYAAVPQRKSTFGDGKTLIFVGANSPPNVTGMKWFLEQIWPMLSDRYRLQIIGTVCDAMERNYKGTENVQFLGQVDSLEPYMKNADISINPVFVGGGLKIKCVDSLAEGLPTVTTPEGAAGLENANLSGLFIARTGAEFAYLIERLAADLKMREAAARAAFEYVTFEFSPKAAVRELARYLTTDADEATSKDKTESEAIEMH